MDTFNMNVEKELKCPDPVMKYCQGCRYGIIHYSDDVETCYDIFGAIFETHCIYGLEEQQPSEEDLKEFYAWYKKEK